MQSRSPLEATSRLKFSDLDDGIRRVGIALTLGVLIVVACAACAGRSAADDAEGDPSDAGEDPPADAGTAEGDAGTDGGDGDGDAGAGPPSLTASRCERDGDALRCPHETVSLVTGVTGLSARDVHFQVPLGAPPAEGFPAAIVFQGSFFPAERAFAGAPDDSFGAIHQAEMVKALLDGGYAVLAPEALGGGDTFWQTNVPPYSFAWETSSDHFFMLAIFEALTSGVFGPLDGDRLMAVGVSSGGYMTSRMAVSYPGKFRALAIHSGSYATCSTLCVVPSLPDDHPPAIFLIGRDDPLVPLGTVNDYVSALEEIADAELVVADGAGHEWIPEAATRVPAWFDTYR